MKKTTLIILLTALVSVSKAQIAGGGRLGYNYILTGIGLTSIGVSGEKAFERQGRKNRTFSTRISAEFAIPKTKNTTEYAYAHSSLTTPQTVDVQTSYRLSMFMLNLDQKMYFGERTMEEGGFYGGLGGSAWLANIKTTYGTYDRANYYVMGNDENGGVSNEKFFQFMLRGFLGFEKTFDRTGVFGELMLNVPANTYNGVPVDIQIETTAAVQVGVRYILVE